MDSRLGAEYLLLSGIQHFAFCPRQWALIHIEQQWQDNLHTFSGQELHRKTNDPFTKEKRGDVIVTRAVPIVSHSLRLYGIADVIEFHRVEQGVELDGRKGYWWPVPVEYKLGRPKPDNSDILQLCAQAICLGEMFGVELDKGYLFYGRTRRRLDVVLDDKLKQETRQTANRMHKVFESGMTPKAHYCRTCDKCSLLDLCIPQLSEKKTIKEYVLKALREG